MSSVPLPTHSTNRNSLRRQSKNQRNIWKAPSAQEVSGYSGNSDTLSSGSRKYRNSTRKITSSSVGPHQREIICHQPEPAYENVAAGGGPRMTLSRYITTNQQVPAAHHTVRKGHQGGLTTLYTLHGGGHPHQNAHVPLIDTSRPSTSPEVQNIYDVIEEKSSGRRTGSLPLHHRPMTPASARTVVSETGVYACGGHCLTFERVCDKVLRVVYGIGVLIGVGLLLAGMNGPQLRVHQNTLMYIGLMVFCVCCFLLWIQCHHYRNRRRRRTMLIRRPVLPQTMIPLQDFTINGNGGAVGGVALGGGMAGSSNVVMLHAANHLGGGGGLSGGACTNHVLLHENPLLHRYIEQQSTYTPAPSELETHATSSLYAQA